MIFCEPRRLVGISFMGLEGVLLKQAKNRFRHVFPLFRQQSKIQTVYEKDESFFSGSVVSFSVRVDNR